MNLNIKYVNKNLGILPNIIMGVDYYTAIKELLDVYNPLTGPIQNIVTYHGTRGGCPAYVGHCKYYDVDDILRKITGVSSIKVGMKETLFAGGKGVHIVDMLLGCLGETVERVIGSYAYFDNNVVKIVEGSYNSLKSKGINCIQPEKLPLFHPEQYKERNFPYKPFNRDSHLGWVKGKKLISGEEIYLPAQLVMIFYFPKPKEDLIGYATSGGLDSHINIFEAIYHGICELIERDAVNTRWICKIPPEKIVFNNNDISSTELKSILNAMEGLPMNIDFYYHPTDIKEVSVVTAISIENHFKRYSYHPGGGADIDVEKAILRSLTEFTQAERNLKLALLFPSREHSHSIDKVFGIGEDAPVSKINIFFKVVIYYGYKKNLEKLRWYLKEGDELPIKSIPSIKLETSKEKYEFILDVMKKYEIDPIFFDFTPNIFKKLKLVKIFIPELTLPFLTSFPYLGHPRYLNLPMKIGMLDRPLTYEELVKDPHPYP